MLKAISFMILGCILWTAGQEILDYNESVRYTACTLKTNDYDGCNKDELKTWLYRIYPERPNIFTCVYPGGSETVWCKIFNIKRSQ